MISRPAPDLPEQLARARRKFRLSLAEFAAELHIRPEWLSKIVNGHVQPSYNIGLRFEAFLRRSGIDPAAFSSGEAGGTVKAEPEDQATRLSSDIFALCRLLVDSAGNDVVRLELIFNELRGLSGQAQKRRPILEKLSEPPAQPSPAPVGDKPQIPRKPRVAASALAQAKSTAGPGTTSVPKPK